MSSKQAAPADRVYKAYWQDGSVDLFAGIGALCIGIAWITDTVVLGPIAPVIIISLWVPFRRRLIEPRLGHVRFDVARRRRLRRAHLVMFAIGCLALLLGVATFFHFRGERADWLHDVIPALPGVLLGVGAVQAAFMFDMPRFAFYAIGFVLGGVGVAVAGIDPGWSLLAGGVIATIAGAVLLARFMRNFPPLPTDLD